MSAYWFHDPAMMLQMSLITLLFQKLIVKKQENWRRSVHILPKAEFAIRHCRVINRTLRLIQH